MAGLRVPALAFGLVRDFGLDLAPAFAVAGDVSQAGGEGRQMSIITMGFGLGVAIGPLLAGVLAIHSFELPFVIGGLLSLVGAWVVYRYVPETVHRSQEVKGSLEVPTPGGPHMDS